MAERKDKSQRSPDSQRRETRSESYIHPGLQRTLSGTTDDHHPKDPVKRKRSYSTNDSIEYAEKVTKPEGWERRRSSLLEMLLGRRSVINTVILGETVDEESTSLESLSLLDISSEEVISVQSQVELGTNEITDGKDHDSIFVDKDSSTDDITSGSGQTVAREITQTDHLNKRLLDSFLARINRFAGNSNSGANLNPNDEVKETGRASPRDYSTLYTDDFLLDHIYRKLEKKK